MMMKWIDPSIEINWEHFVLNQYNDWYCSKVLLIMIELRFVHVSLSFLCAVYPKCIDFLCVISIRVVNFWYSIINNRIWWSMDRARKMNKKHINDWTQKIWIKNRYQDILLLFMIGAAIDVLFWFLFCIFRRFFGWAHSLTICEILVAGRLLHVWAVNWPRNIMQDTRQQTRCSTVYAQELYSTAIDGFRMHIFLSFTMLLFISTIMHAYEASEFHIQYIIHTFVR